jgi:zinc protease
MHTVRDKQGFTYGVAAGVIDDSIADGAFNISATFAPALLEKGLASTREVLATWWQDGITDDELAARKRGMVGSYAVGLSTTAGVAGFILISLQRGYDLPWLDEYPRAIEAITRDQVNRAIRAHLDPSKMVLVEAGSLGAAPSAPAVAPN